MATKAVRAVQGGHVTSILLVFCTWKCLLLVLAAFAPGPGYDTSAFIMLDSSTRRYEDFNYMSRGSRLALNLFRWDALYFVKAAEQTKIHEQEWAFSWAYSHLLKAAAQFVFGCAECPLQYYIVAGMVIANICHLCSVFVLYHLVILIVEQPRRRQVAFVASVLHILTPAGLFLSAPYAEALFSLLNFAGMLLYARSKTERQLPSSNVLSDAVMICSGALFALACLIRSNGLLSGILFLYDLTEQLLGLMGAQLRMQDCRQMLVTCIAGATILLGFIAPQAIAYNEFCIGTDTRAGRPWCEKTIPSIYSWVQSHYWNVGLFRYWTIPNLPLFAMAAPMLWVVVHSSTLVLRSGLPRQLHGRSVPQSRTESRSNGNGNAAYTLPELAMPELVLALMALTTFHVQIIYRIASGYPTWYMILATSLVKKETSMSDLNVTQGSSWFIRGMIVYALVQGLLYANFLPPA